MLERIYNIPLRKEFRKAPKYKRAMKSIKAVREFLQRHMKCDKVLIGSSINLKIHEHGRKNVCHHINVKAQKDKVKVKGKDVEVVRAELANVAIKWPEKETKKKSKKKEESKVEGEVAELKEKIEEAVSQKAEKAAKEEKKIIHDKLDKKQVDTSIKKVEDKEDSVKKTKKELFPKDQKPKHERRTEKK